MDESLLYTHSQMEQVAEAAAAKAIASLLNFDNSILHETPESESAMSKNNSKIRRRFEYGGSVIWITASSEKEYAEKILATLGAFNQSCASANVPVEKHPFNVFAADWFEHFSKPNITPVTAISYERQLNNLIYPAFADKNVEDITVDDVQKFFNSFPRGTKKETKAKAKNVLGQILKKAYEDGLLPRNPMQSSSLRITGEKSEATKPYSIDQMRYLAAHLSDLTDSRDRAWLALSISLPLRPEEVLGLRWADIDMKSQTVFVRNTVTHPTRNEPHFVESTKTAASRRVLKLPKEIMPFLPEAGAPDEFIVGGTKPLSYTALRRMRQRIAKLINFEEDITPRRFRTTVATDISAETHDIKLVQQMLGHTNPDVTLKYYDKGRSTAVDASSAIASCYGLS